jgi:hypothetical protein
LASLFERGHCRIFAGLNAVTERLTRRRLRRGSEARDPPPTRTKGAAFARHEEGGKKSRR